MPAVGPDVVIDGASQLARRIAVHPKTVQLNPAGVKFITLYLDLCGRREEGERNENQCVSHPQTGTDYLVVGHGYSSWLCGGKVGDPPARFFDSFGRGFPDVLRGIGCVIKGFFPPIADFTTCCCRS